MDAGDAFIQHPRLQPVAYPEIFNWGGVERRGAEGAEGGGVWGGGIPLPLGVGSGEGALPPPQKIFGFFISKR